MVKELKIEVTEQCDRKCIHCSSNAKDRNFIAMNPVIVKKLITQAKDLKMETVVFTGGEVTLYPYLERAICYATTKNLKTKIYTMATPDYDTIKLIQNLVFYGLGEMVYSTAFRLTRDGIVDMQKLQTFFPKLIKNTNVLLGVHHVVTKDTLEDIEPAMELFFSLPYNRTTTFSLLRYVPHGRGDQSLVLNREETLYLKEKIKNWKEKYGDKLRLGSPWNYLGLTYVPCTAASKTMVVGFDGNVYPCDAMKYFNYLGSGGNVYEKKLKDIYNSIYFKEIREATNFHHEECGKCPQFSTCNGGCLGQKMVTYLDTNSLTFAEYGNQALRTMKNFSSLSNKKMNGELGLIGELGEFLDSFKKYKTHELDREHSEKIRKNLVVEAGDILWYIAASLGSSYQISFADIGDFLMKKKSSSRFEITSFDVESCSERKDPDCLYQAKDSEYPLTFLDTLVSKNYDFNEEWKNLVSIACQILYAKNREEALERSSAFVVSLSTIVNYELNASMEAVAQANIEKLKSRYEKGFDTSIANSRVTLLTDYKEKEIEVPKAYQKQIKKDN